MSREPGNKGKKYPAEPLARSEVEALIKTCSKRAPTGVRNAALISLLWRSGLRISEALSLKPKDIDTERQSLRVLFGKGQKSRTVGLDSLAAASIGRWLDRRAQLGINGHAPLFCTLKGKTVRANYVRELLPRLARRAGIEKRVHPHGLRHTFAFELANERMPIHYIQAALGHSSLATTDRYIRHVAAADVVEMMAGRNLETTQNHTGV